MRKALSLPLPIVPAAAALWLLAAGEVATALLLAAGGHLPPLAIRALQLFLRF